MFEVLQLILPKAVELCGFDIKYNSYLINGLTRIRADAHV